MPIPIFDRICFSEPKSISDTLSSDIWVREEITYIL